VRAEQARGASFAFAGLASEREFAIDDGAAQRAFGVVVGRLDAAMVGSLAPGSDRTLD
jgi:hypothetical protein